MATTMSGRLQASAGSAVSRFYARGPKRYRLQASLAVSHVETGEFERAVDAFRRALLADGETSCVKVEGDAADERIEAEFYFTADSFADANLLSGKIILRALKQSVADSRGLTGVEQLENADEVDGEIAEIVDSQSTQLSLA